MFYFHISLFLRRIRFKALKAEPDIKKIKIKTHETRRLLSLAAPEKYKLAFDMLLLVISSAVTMSVPFGIGKLIDFIQNRDFAGEFEKNNAYNEFSVLIFVVFT